MRLALCVALLGGCIQDGTFRCEPSSKCSDGTQMGFCEPTGYCSFPDPTCPSGRRYGQFSSPANTCTDPIIEIGKKLGKQALEEAGTWSVDWFGEGQNPETAAWLAEGLHRSLAPAIAPQVLGGTGTQRSSQIST